MNPNLTAFIVYHLSTPSKFPGHPITLKFLLLLLLHRCGNGLLRYHRRFSCPASPPKAAFAFLSHRLLVTAGGSLAFLQNGIDAYNHNDWGILTGNVPKVLRIRDCTCAYLCTEPSVGCCWDESTSNL